MSGLLTAEAIRERFSALTELLSSHRAIWEPRPFASVRPAWAEDHPEVASYLLGLGDDEVQRVEEAPLTMTGLPATLRSWAARAGALTEVSTVPGRGHERLADDRVQARVPGRKWRQIEAFAQAFGAHPEVSLIVDWCAGKGHLGRTLGAMTGLPVTLLEHDTSLRPEALTLSRKVGVELSFAALDAHAPDALGLLGGETAAVALHACGGLLCSLLAGSVARGVPLIQAAPCCYHRAHVDHRGTRPMSATARAAPPLLTHSALRLATADEVVARTKLRHARRRENAWRLGLDALLREASGVDAYTPLGTLPAALLTLDFGPFCEAVAARLGLELPPRWDPARAEADGWERAHAARVLGLVRGLFRGPLELWLTLDRALYLAEAGYEVRVERFCPRAITPRNLLLSARL